MKRFTKGVFYFSTSNDTEQGDAKKNYIDLNGGNGAL